MTKLVADNTHKRYQAVQIGGKALGLLRLKKLTPKISEKIHIPRLISGKRSISVPPFFVIPLMLDTFETF